MSLLTIDSLILNYGEKRVLSDVFMRFETGTVTGILGRNGAGKSSLLKVLFGTLSTEGVSIRHNGSAITKAYQLTNFIAYLPQDDFLPGTLTVKTALALAGIQIAELTTRFPKYTALLKSKVNHLSGGERRLLETYIILKKKAHYVLLDEPFSYLSPLQVIKLKELINSEKVNKGIIITDHLYEHVIDISDSMFLLRNGKNYTVSSKTELAQLGYIPLPENN